MTMTDEELGHYSAALDEIHYLRAMCATSYLILCDVDEYKSVPKGLQYAIDNSRKLLLDSARGIPRTMTRPDLRLGAVGALRTLTRDQWETNRGRADE